MRNGTARLAGLAVLLLAGVGCAFSHMGPGSGGGNPDYPTSDDDYVRDGFQDEKTPYVWRVYLDADGSVAPDPRVHAVGDDLYRESGSRLTEYFRRLGKTYRSADVAADFGRRIREGCGTSGTLVILIRGINNTYDETRRNYKAARLQLRDLSGRDDLRFLELYWDGRTGNALGLWPFARESSKWAGLGLRPLLRELGGDLDVRVLTHSRGASVIASALWNLPLRESAEAELRFERRQREEPTPDARRYRLAMIVPAMGGEDFGSCPRNGLDRVIVGVNPDDDAVGKGPLPASCLGSTTLGCDPEDFRRHVDPRLNEADRRAFLVDFSNSPAHDFKEYLFRRPFEAAMFPLLFEGGAYQARSIPAVTIAP